MKNLTDMGHGDEGYVKDLHNSPIKKWLYGLVGMLPPLPEFCVGDEIEWNDDDWDFRDGDGPKITRVRATFLGNDRRFWFVRVDGWPGSFSSDQFKKPSSVPQWFR